MELKRYLEIIWRRKWVLIQTIGVIAGCALLASFRVTPIYNASAHLLIKTEDLQSQYIAQAQVLQLPRDLGTMGYIETRNAVDTYIALAKGSSVLGKVIEELDLKDAKGKVIEVKDFVTSMPRSPKLIFGQKKGVNIKRMKAAEMLEITGYSTQREEAAKIADSVAGSFSAFISNLWRQEASSARRSIEKQLRQFELLVFFADLWREQEASRQPLGNSSAGSGRKRVTEEESAEQMRGGGDVLDVEDQVSVLIAELADLELEKDTLQKSFQKASSSLDATKSMSLRGQIKALSEQIDQKKKIAGEIVKSSPELPPFMGRLMILGDAYNHLRMRLEYAKIAETMEISNVVIVQPAALSVYPRHDIYFPKRGLIAVMSLLLSTAFGVFLCFLLEYLDDSLKTVEEIHEKLNQPVLGVIRKIKRGNLRILGRGEKGADFYGDFWDMRSNIKMATLDKDCKILAVTSSARGEGKSTVSRYLAHIFVDAGQKVLLMDVNLRRPCLHKMLNLPNSAGLSHFLKGEKEIKEIIASTKKGGADFIPAGAPFANPLKMIDSANMPRLIQLIRPNYDVIILDMPALEDGSDAAVTGSYADGVLFVVGSGDTQAYHCKKALGIIQRTKASLLGVVLNKAAK